MTGVCKLGWRKQEHYIRSDQDQYFSILKSVSIVLKNQQWEKRTIFIVADL